MWLLLGCSWAFGQAGSGAMNDDRRPTRTFSSLEELWSYSAEQSLTLQNNNIQMDAARKAKLAAVLGTIDLTGNLLSAQFTNNTTLGVTPFPAEIFGGEPGTFKDVQTGVQYNTNLTNYAEVKLINPTGWTNLKLSKINIDLTESNNQMTVKTLQENVAATYYNIVNLTEQIESSQENLVVADTLFQIARSKYEEGLVKQQDVNDSRVNYLQTEEQIRQLEYMREQTYLSLKLLCDIPETENIVIQDNPAPKLFRQPTVLLNELNLTNAMLKEQYAQQNYKASKAAFVPTVSLQLSNSNNLYNTEFEPVTGNWINSNYVGLRLNIPIPNANQISRKYSAQFDHQLALNQTQQARNQATLDQQTLQSEYKQALSQFETNKEIKDLREDSYFKNQNLYREGIIGLDVVLNSYNAMVNADWNLISSKVNVELVGANIEINNTVR